MVAPTQSVSAPLTSATTGVRTATSSAQYLVAPIGSSGLAFLGEQGKIASVAKQRISSFTDDGALNVTVQFGAGDGPVTLIGYAPAAPKVTASSGTVGAVTYTATSKLFSVPVTGAGGSATTRISP